MQRPAPQENAPAIPRGPARRGRDVRPGGARAAGVRWWRGLRAGLLLLGLALGGVGAGAAMDASAARVYDVPAGDASDALKELSAQSGEQIIYPVEHVRGARTQPVNGRFTVRAALATMLAGTGLEAIEDQAGGAFAIRRTAAGPRRPPVAHPARAGGEGTAGQGSDIVLLSPFEVFSRADVGYDAANSVTATRIAMPIRDLPMSITAFTGDFIADRKPYDLYDVVKWAPGVHQDNQSPQGWVRYSIRGFNSAAVQRNGFGSFRFIDTTNVARVEVVKGPASLLYGQINPGGVINYITKRPEPRPALRLETGLGDRDYKRIMVDATGPVPVAGASDRLFYRAIAMAEDIQQFQAGARGKKFLFAPSATWRLSAHAALTVELEHFERLEEMLTGGVIMSYRDGVAVRPYPGLPWDFSYAGEGDYQDFVSDVFTAELTARLGAHLDVKATYLDAYWDMEWRATGQGGAGLLAQSFIDHYYPPQAGLGSADAMYRRNRWEHHWGGERAAQLDVGGAFELGDVSFRALVGGRANLSARTRFQQKVNPNVAGHPAYLKPWDLRNPATWDRRVPFGLEALLATIDAQNSSHSASVYAVVSAAWRDRVRFLGGYGYHRIHNDPTHNFLAGTSTPPADRDAGIPQAGALVALTPELSAFVSYSESFVGNTSMLRVDSVPTTPAAPVRGRGRELGLKLELLGGRVSGTVSAYSMEASPTGIITFTSGLDPSGATVFTDVQGGRQLSEGYELDVLVSPMAGLQIVAAFGRCDAVYRRHPTNPALNGTPLAATPDRTFSLWAKYAPEGGALSGLSFTGGLNHVGSYSYVGNNPLSRSDPYTTVDLGIGYRFGAFARDWHVDLAVKNVGNERYYASSTSWGFPRHAILSLRTRF